MTTLCIPLGCSVKSVRMDHRPSFRTGGFSSETAPNEISRTPSNSFIISFCQTGFRSLYLAFIHIGGNDGRARSCSRAPDDPAMGAAPPRRVRVRSSKDLNNRIEQDHRRIKQRTRPMLGFKRFDNAAVTISLPSRSQRWRAPDISPKHAGKRLGRL
jgi:hypothetical protein